MAGMGPPPKAPGARQRRNRVAGAALLAAESRPSKRAPALPHTHEWHELTRAWWRDVWRSPMADEYLRSDVHGLYVLAELVDQFWRAPSVKLSGEIRLLGQCFGLSPIDRRRLQWEVARAQATDRRANAAAPSRARLVGDPRAVLHAVS